MQSPTVQKMFTLDLTKNNSTDLNMNDNTGISRNDCKDLTNNGSNVLTRNDDSSGITSNDSFDLTRNNNTIQESHDEDSVNLNWLMNLSAASIFPSSSSHQTNTKASVYSRYGSRKIPHRKILHRKNSHKEDFAQGIFFLCGIILCAFVRPPFSKYLLQLLYIVDTVLGRFPKGRFCISRMRTRKNSHREYSS
ncbi:hypothetical protein O3M35_003982 [Rhynocoris fuscipes]|uniref:Uncharacterized protein n=1 Tax=Rhynocoris fuscipes TaxID=488301 RepID=A0AAW1CHZ0_9HEMI